MITPGICLQNLIGLKLAGEEKLRLIIRRRADVRRSVAAHLRELVGNRRRARRYKARCRAHLLFSSSNLVLPLEGYTRDISAVGVMLNVSAINIDNAYFADEGRSLRIILELPKGSVEMRATPVRHERLQMNYLIGARITEMNVADRARLDEFIYALR